MDSYTHMAMMNEQTKRVDPAKERIKNRLALRNEMLEFLHRKPSDCGLDVEQLKAEAIERLRKPKLEKAEYTPPKPEDWQVAYLVSPSHPERKHKVNSNCKRAKQLSKGKRKEWSMNNVNKINMSVQRKQKRQSFDDAASYAR
jgi:hypothetical protein